MLKKYFFIAILFVSACTGSKQKPNAAPRAIVSGNTNEPTVHAIYNHRKLSKQFDLKVEYTHYPSQDEHQDSFMVKTTVLNKEGMPLDSMKWSTHFYYNYVFSSDTNVRSYSCHVNENAEIVDNNFGDVVVADLNFDGLDDIAIVRETNNAGVLYNYYLQTPKNRFLADAFLNDSVGSFPQEIDYEKKVIVTYNRSGCCHVGKHTYTLKSNDWTESKYELLGLEE